MYQASCTHPERQDPRALGDLDAARATCQACTLIGIFRPDSDWPRRRPRRKDASEMACKPSSVPIAVIGDGHPSTATVTRHL